MTVVDGVGELDAEVRAVVSVSDVHGHPDRLESALLTLADHPDFEPVVERDGDALRWVGDDSVLVVNGDLVNRGPDSAACLDLVDRLRAQAPGGHVRHLVGNHELVVPYPSPPEWDRFYADRIDDAERRAFWERVLACEVAVAFEGHRVTYSHAGSPDGVDAAALNERFRALARELVDRVGDDGERAVFERVVAERTTAIEWPDVDEVREMRANPAAGVVWLDFSFLPQDAPPQVVGHTPHDRPTRKGDVVCQDVVLANADSPGGEAVLVETPDGLRAVSRTPDGDVRERAI